MINHLWSFSMANSGESVGLWNVTDDHVAWTGMRLGRGIFGMGIYTETGASRTAADAGEITPYAVPNPTWLADASSGVSYLGGSANVGLYSR